MKNGEICKTRNPVTDVYVAEIPQKLIYVPLYPQSREAEIQACSNERVRRQKYCVWKLLGYAVKRSFGAEITDFSFSKNEYGKWGSPSFCFSLSHSANAVAVAISIGNVGVDVERFAPLRDGMEKHILTSAERRTFDGLQGDEKLPFLLEKWTQKESLFKASSLSRFKPAETEVGENVWTKRVFVADEAYVLSVATSEEIRLFENVGLSDE